MSDVTQILAAVERGEPQAAEQLLPLVYDELRKLAAQRLTQEKPGQTLQATALVHEAYVRLVDTDRVQQWNSRGHFFSAAAEAMRRILIERARRHQRLRHGGGHTRLDLDRLEVMDEQASEVLLALDEALDRLESEEPEATRVVKLRYFAGLKLEDVATAMGISLRTANRHWAYARAWLYRDLNDRDNRSE